MEHAFYSKYSLQIWKTRVYALYLVSKESKMKKIIYIAIAFFAFGMTSCNKQDIQPNANGTSQEPVWKSTGSEVEGGSSEGGTEEGGIVDPNTDPDGDKKKKP